MAVMIGNEYLVHAVISFPLRQHMHSVQNSALELDSRVFSPSCFEIGK